MTDIKEIKNPDDLFIYGDLKQKMKDEGYNISTLSEAMNLQRITLNRKLLGQSWFSQKDIYQICRLLNIDLKHISTYFFQTRADE